MMRCVIGLDDTDSRFGRCTTHLGFLIVQALAGEGCRFDTYPRLVRLNPNIPFKTRGNAAVCIPFSTERPGGAYELARSLMMEHADVDNGANSGLVFLKRAPTSMYSELYSGAISRMLNHHKVLRLLSDAGARFSTLGNGMGLVGAAASIGFRPEDDHTYELIAYRTPDMCGTPRVLDPASVQAMERATFPHTFNDYDHQTGRVLLTPHGPDPVFLGIRADSPTVALRAFRMVRYEEELAGHLIYVSNQCTDAHIASRLTAPIKAYHSGWAEGVVESVHVGTGGHLYLDLELDEGSTTISCAVYRPTRDLRATAAYLASGDRVRLSGGVRRSTRSRGPILNVEKIEVLSTARDVVRVNPKCDLCDRRMKSEGVGKGFQCRACGRRSMAQRLEVRTARRLVPGVYLPSPGAQRHLTKQLFRYGQERSRVHPLVEGWLDGATIVRPLTAPARSHG